MDVAALGPVFSSQPYVLRSTSLWRLPGAHVRSLVSDAGFIPNSMVSPTGRPDAGVPVEAMFVEVDELRNRMILSQRQLQQTSLLATLKPGTVVEV
jgi:ribosomal protein S1